MAAKEIINSFTTYDWIFMQRLINSDKYKFGLHNIIIDAKDRMLKLIEDALDSEDPVHKYVIEQTKNITEDNLKYFVCLILDRE